jgi:hypothetical protein
VKILAILAALVFVAASPVGAQQTNNTPYSLCNNALISDTAAHTCKTVTFGSAYLVMVENVSGSAQTGELDCTDNGVVFARFAQMGIGQYATYPNPGKAFVHDLTCTATSANTGGGYAVYFR